MREIKFRIRYRDGKWYYGMPISQIKNNSVAFNSFDGSYYDLFADATTLGQFTGLKDKNGNEVYEGDIVRGKDYTGLKREGIVTYDEYGAEYIIVPNTKSQYREHNNAETLCPADEYLEVVGNIWDNPELLEEKC